jgi:hypothetical protein
MSDVLFRHPKALGKLADLVLVDANPLADIANARRARAIVANSRLYRRRDLDRLPRTPRRSVNELAMLAWPAAALFGSSHLTGAPG